MLKKIFVFILMTLLLAGCAAPAQEIPEATQPLTEPTAVPTLPEPAEPETTQPATEETLPPPPTLHSGIREDGSFQLIRRAETPADYFRTFDFSDIFKGVD